jgi:hypothetical protein
MDAQAPSCWAPVGPPGHPEFHALSAPSSNNTSFRELLNSSPKLQKHPTPPCMGLDTQYEMASTMRPTEPLVRQHHEDTPQRQEQLLPIPKGYYYGPPSENYTTLSTENSHMRQPGVPYIAESYLPKRRGYKSGHFACPFSRPRARDNPDVLLCSKVFKNRRSVIHLQAL